MRRGRISGGAGYAAVQDMRKICDREVSAIGALRRENI